MAQRNPLSDFNSLESKYKGTIMYFFQETPTYVQVVAVKLSGQCGHKLALFVE
jgi:hypothetical protein